MIKNLAELRSMIAAGEKKTCAVACAHDAHTLEAIMTMRNEGLMNCLLVGHTEEIKKIAEDAGKEFDAYKKEVSEQQLGYIKNDLLMKKIIAFLMENNTFEKKETKKKTVKEEK